MKKMKKKQENPFNILKELYGMPLPFLNIKIIFKF